MIAELDLGFVELELIPEIPSQESDNEIVNKIDVYGDRYRRCWRKVAQSADTVRREHELRSLRMMQPLAHEALSLDDM